MAYALDIVKRYFPQVKTVKDAEEDAVIDVTSKDSLTAKTKDHKNCAMAVAAKRMFHADGVIVSLSKAYIIRDNMALRFNLPESVSREVVSFDRKGGFAPGRYDLLKPRVGQRLGDYQGKAGGGHNTPKRKMKKMHMTEGVRTVLGSKKGIS